MGLDDDRLDDRPTGRVPAAARPPAPCAPQSRDMTRYLDLDRATATQIIPFGTA
jgi:hypothetical protein